MADELTTEQEIASYKRMIRNATNALEQLSIGAQETVTVENRSFTFMDRNDLMNFIAQLKDVLFDLENPDQRTFTVYQPNLLS